MIDSIIIGAGTYGEVYAAYLAESNNFRVVGFLDDDPEKIGKTLGGLEVRGPVNPLLKKYQRKGVQAVFAPIGNNELRKSFLLLSNALGYQCPSFIHPTANVHPTVKLGRAVYILPETNIMPSTQISDFVMISMGVNIAHHVIIQEGCFISMGVNVGASICIGKNAYLGMASSLMTGVQIVGEGALIGAGSMILHDVPEKAVMVGNPGRILRYKE